MRFFAFLVLAAFPAAAQQQLSLREAVRLALAQNKSIAASQADLNAASAKVQEARAGLLPKVNYSESLTRSNNPVFVFSSLLAQHQFTQSNFNIYALNRPGFLDNFQSAVSADQVLFDAGQTRKATRSAELNRRIVSEDDRQVRSQLTLLVVKSYLDVVLGQQAVDAAEQAVKSAQADLERAENVRRAGRSTDADVLSIRVHLARMREQTIRNDAALKTAQAALNDVLGEPIDTPYT
ncbi:MAG TPA: TolC family protein, partial [Bryobacteraceae bacterium]|nr:TolC family protein [Bryobacteraceae bacterium]